MSVWVRAQIWGLVGLITLCASGATAQKEEMPSPTLAPEVWVYVPESPREAEFEALHHRNWLVASGGIALLAAGWLGGFEGTLFWALDSVCFSFCTAPTGPRADALWQTAIPLVGPILSIATDQFPGSAVAAPIIFEALQLTGLILIIVGLTDVHEVDLGPVWVRGDSIQFSF